MIQWATLGFIPLRFNGNKLLELAGLGEAKLFTTTTIFRVIDRDVGTETNLLPKDMDAKPGLSLTLRAARCPRWQPAPGPRPSHPFQSLRVVSCT